MNNQTEKFAQTALHLYCDNRQTASERARQRIRRGQFDIRFVIHAQMPGSLEAYYQEAGRGGRDGEPADGIQSFELKNKHVQQFFLRGRYPDVEQVLRIAEALRRLAGENDGQRLSNR